MDAKEFIKERNRMCDYFVSTGACANCPLRIVKGYTTCSFIRDYTEEMVQAVEKWSKENPVKTNGDVIKETFGEVIIDTQYSYGLSAIRLNGERISDWLKREYKKPEKK